MITLHETLTVPRSIEDCFRYVADFRTTVEWDASAIRATKLSAEPIGPGSRFQVDCALGPTAIRLMYEIEEYQPWHSLVLRGRSRWFEVKDTIVFTQQGDATHIDYSAEFVFPSWLGTLEERMIEPMRGMGRASIAGLALALSDDNPPPRPEHDEPVLKGRLVSEIAMFSRLGFQRASKRWLPVSRFLDGCHVLITGATSGLGFETAVALAEAGAALTLVIRDRTRQTELRERIVELTGQEDVAVELADLSSMAQVDALATRLLDQGRPIDVLINNAGALFNEHGLSAEGLERSFALLLLSPWRLTRALHPLLAGHDTPARIINVVSGGMYAERLNCDRLIMDPEGYQGPRAYARAKRALTVLTEQWAQQWRDDRIVVNAMHPGWADTPGVASALPTFRTLTRPILRTPGEGADTIVWLARAREAGAVSGQLFLDRTIRPTHLQSRTVESQSQRDRLQGFLEACEARVTSGV